MLHDLKKIRKSNFSHLSHLVGRQVSKAMKPKMRTQRAERSEFAITLMSSLWVLLERFDPIEC